MSDPIKTTRRSASARVRMARKVRIARGLFVALSGLGMVAYFLYILVISTISALFGMLTLPVVLASGVVCVGLVAVVWSLLATCEAIILATVDLHELRRNMDAS